MERTNISLGKDLRKEVLPVLETETLADTRSRTERGMERGGERDGQTGADRKTDIQKTGGQRFEIDRQAGIQACRQTDTEKEIEFGQTDRQA